MERITHLLLLLIFCLIPGHHCGKGKQRLPVGTIFSVEDFPALAAIKHEFDLHANETTSFEVDALVKQVKSYDPVHVRRAVCQLVDLGVYAILSPSDSVAGDVLSSLSNQFHLPVVCPVFPDTSQIPRFGVSLSPSTVRAVSDLIHLYRWNSFTFFYDTPDGLQRFQQLFDHNPKLVPGGLHSITSAKEVKHILRKFDVSSPIPVILAMSFHLAVDVIEAVNRDSYFAHRGFHFLLMNPTTEKLPLTSSVHATYLQLAEAANDTRKWQSKNKVAIRRTGTASLRDLTLSSIDAADVVLQAFSRLTDEHPHVLRDNFKVSEISCLREEKLPWQHGSLVSQYLRHSHISDGLTGNVQFGSKGQRRHFSFDVIETTPMEHLKVASWSDDAGLTVIRSPSVDVFLRDASSAPNTLKGKKFRVTTIASQPFLFQNEVNNELEGYLKDLMETLSGELGFTYDMSIVKDGSYGTLKDGKWTGMIGEIIRDEADFAIAPLTITSQRESAVDFSKPYMSAGITVMIKKPDPATTMSPASSTFFFLHAFSYDVWICFIVTYVGISALSWAICRFTGVPDFVTQNEAEQKFSVSNSFWCSVSHLLLRGVGIYPRSASHRLITLVWWLFTLVAVAMFTSNMASMIIQDKTGMGGSIGAPLGDAYSVMEEAVTRGVPDLGVLKSGSTEAFFKTAKIKLYRKYAQYLYKNPDVAVSTYAEGIEKVRNSDGKYALLIESPNNEYVSSKMPCDTIMVPGTFNSINYGIAMKQNSPYRSDLDQGLLKLKEKGELRMLYNRWWKDDNVCEQIKKRRKFTDIYSSSLTLSQVAGLFYVFIIGALLAFVAAVAEYLLKSRKEKGDQPKAGPASS